MSNVFYEDQWLTMLVGDCREVLAELPEQSVHMMMTSPPYFGLRSYLDADNPDKAKEIGREVSPDEYVEAMVEVMRGVRRVLRDDGTVWLNIGDSYAAQRGGTAMPAETLSGGVGGYGPDEARRGRGSDYQPHRNASSIGLKHKDLIGIPWRVAFGLQADGWYLRNAIVWETPNPMPESVTDRFTNSYEMVFLLSKMPKYFFDQDAVREPHTQVTLDRIEYGLKHKHPDGIGVAIPPVDTDRMGERFAHAGGRNKRDVWTIPTHPYKGAHYAVFPKALVEPCIKAGTSEKGCCPTCGAPWKRAVEIESSWAERKENGATRGNVAEPGLVGAGTQRGVHGAGVSHDLDAKRRETVGWVKSCGCEADEPVPCVVLDPFAGSGTVGVVAQELSRRAVLIDLNADYMQLQLARNSQVTLGLDILSPSVDGHGTLV